MKRTLLHAVGAAGFLFCRIIDGFGVLFLALTAAELWSPEALPPEVGAVVRPLWPLAVAVGLFLASMVMILRPFRRPPAASAESAE